MCPSAVPLALEPELDPRRFQKGIHRGSISIGTTPGSMDPWTLQNVSVGGSIGIGTRARSKEVPKRYPSRFHCHWNHAWDPCIQVLCTMYPQQLNQQWTQFWLHESKDIMNFTLTFCIRNGNNFGYTYPLQFQHVSVSGSIVIGTTVGSMDIFVTQSTKIHDSHSSYSDFYLNSTTINVFDAYN